VELHPGLGSNCRARRAMRPANSAAVPGVVSGAPGRMRRCGFGYNPVSLPHRDDPRRLASQGVCASNEAVVEPVANGSDFIHTAREWLVSKDPHHRGSMSPCYSTGTLNVRGPTRLTHMRRYSCQGPNLRRSVSPRRPLNERNIVHALVCPFGEFFNQSASWHVLDFELGE
jgi:hypothetical protein